jgi:hypothetical protein
MRDDILVVVDERGSRLTEEQYSHSNLIRKRVYDVM